MRKRHSRSSQGLHKTQRSALSCNYFIFTAYSKILSWQLVTFNYCHFTLDIHYKDLQGTVTPRRNHIIFINQHVWWEKGSCRLALSACRNRTFRVYIHFIFIFFYDSNVCSSHNSQDISSAFTTKSSFHYTVNGHIFGSHPIRQTFSRVLLSSVY